MSWSGARKGASRYVCKADRQQQRDVAAQWQQLLLSNNILHDVAADKQLQSLVRPVVCNTPLGLPVLPEVYKRNKGSSAFIHSTCKKQFVPCEGLYFPGHSQCLQQLPTYNATIGARVQQSACGHAESQQACACIAERGGKGPPAHGVGKSTFQSISNTLHRDLPMHACKHKSV